MWKSIISLQNPQCSPIFYLMISIMSCWCSQYVSCYSNASVTSSSSPKPLCLPHQRTALLHFKQEFAFLKPDFTSYRYGCSIYANSYYSDINDQSYPKMKFWNDVEMDCCSWEGVTCDMTTGQVVGLDLANSWIQGPLHSNSSLFKLHQLQDINLSFNNFTFSKIPAEFGRLSRLTHLNLSFSMFAGNVPSEISFLAYLVSLDLSTFQKYDETSILSLSETDFTCIIQNMTNLKRLHLHQVNISSPVPETLVNLSSLTSLHLGGCGLLGNFPVNIFLFPNMQIIYLACNNLLFGFLSHFQPSSSLGILNLDYTYFWGKLPNSIGYLKSLNRLSISNCNFVGPIPSSVWNLSQLVYLDLSLNHFTGHNLPSTLGSLAKLTHLFLKSCEFNGEVPNSLANLTRLEVLDLSSNSFAGPIPASLGNLKLLQDISFQYNNFRGQIPVSFGNLTLKTLDLSYNHLGGEIPSFLFMLSSLSLLDLYNNQFTGSLCIQNVSVSQLQTLDLAFNNLNGQIPQSIFEVVNLVYLSLASNKLSGIVEFSNFSKLLKLQDLSLSSNSLTITNTNLSTTKLPKFLSLGLSSCNISEFPDFLQTQDQLETLDLSFNRIEGQIPNWFLIAIRKMKLDYIDLGGNKLHGSLIVPPLSISLFCISNNNFSGEIHSSFQKWSNLRVFDISYNHFGGTIPRWLCNFSSSLEELNLRWNKFEGKLEQILTFGSMHNLKFLDLSHNQFQGKIPQSLINCKELQILNLGHNRISDTFPFWLQNLPELQVLVLGSNIFYGAIWHPHKFQGFVKLGYMDLSFNNFNESLPAKYFKNWGRMSAKGVDVKNPFDAYSGVLYFDGMNWYYRMDVMSKGVEMEDNYLSITFTSLDLSYNRFVGEIPSSIGDMHALVALNLSGNSFTGPIPPSVGNMKELQSLDLSKNKLSGRIPQELTNISFLAYLNLSQNQFVGPIPQSAQFSTYPNSSFQENPGLCGSPLSKQCEPKETPTVSHQSKVESIFSWKEVAMGYGCGFVVGCVIGYVLIFRQGPTGLFWRSFIGRYILQRS